MKRHARGLLVRSLLLGSALGFSLGLEAHAQEKAATVEEVVVTGSALPTTLDAVAVPVNTVSSEDMQKAGGSPNALEILRKQLPAFEGRSNAGNSNANNTNQNTAGGSQAQLRNLDTLVLINGRRSAISAIAGVGGKAFVDINMIPASAIDRIEVLADGASAIYGSDAVGGVVNFILKSKFDGVEAGGRYGGADKGYTERSGYVVAGHSFGDRLDVMVTGSVSRTDPLYQKDRSFSSPFFVTSGQVPGAVGTNLLVSSLLSPSQKNPTGIAAVAPDIAALVANGTYQALSSPLIGATYDLSQFQTLLLQQDQDAVTANVTYDILGAGRLVAFGDFEYGHAKSFTQFLPRVSTVTVPQGSPFNPVAGAVGGVIFAETTQPKQYRNDSESFRATAGLRGDFDAFSRNFRWEAAYVHSQDDLEQRQKNVIYAPNLALAIAGGFDSNGVATPGGAYSKVFPGFTDTGALVLQPALDPFARGGRSAASLANLFGTEVINAQSRLESFDAKITTNLLTLPAGDVGLALGGGWRRESLSAHADINGFNTGPTAKRWIGGQFNDPFSKSRTITSGFGEIRIPITGPDWHAPLLYAFDLIGALRFEHYSDAGDSTVPKIGFRWQPVDPQVTVRGTYSKSFTAPTLYAEYGPTATRIAGGGIVPGAFPGLPQSPFPVEDGNNPNLQPSHAKSFSLGVVIKPDFLPGFRGSLEYFSVDQTGLAGGIGFSNILLDVNAKGSASLFAGNIAKGNFPGLPGATPFVNPGDLLAYLTVPGNSNNVYAIDQFRNLGGIKVRSMDVQAEYSWTWGDRGRFTASSLGTWLNSYQFQVLPGQRFYQYAGTATNGGTGVQGTLPRLRFYSSLDWTYRNWDVTLGSNYVSAVHDLGVGGITFQTNSQRTPPTAFALRVKSYATFDLRTAYHFDGDAAVLKGWTAAVGVTNLFDQAPPHSPNAFTDNGADVATYSPIGRFIYATVSARF